VTELNGDRELVMVDHFAENVWMSDENSRQTNKLSTRVCRSFLSLLAISELRMIFHINV